MHLPTLEVESIMSIQVNFNRIIEYQCIVIRSMQYYVHFGTLKLNDTNCAIYVRFL